MSKAQAIFNGIVTALALLLITGLLAVILTAVYVGTLKIAMYLWGM